MALTYTGSRNLYGKFTLNTETNNLSFGDTMINEATRALVNHRNWKFREGVDTISVVASTQSYTLTAVVGKVIDVTVTSGTTVYHPKKCSSFSHWLRLNQTTSTTSTSPEWFFLIGNTIYLYPTPSTSITNGLSVYYEKKHVDLSIPDYTTGSIVTATAASTAIVGSGTSWTAKMAGQWLKITNSNTANTGDGRWYQIASVTDTTNLVLTQPYEGTSIAAGSAAYTIGECSILPEDYQILPVYRATEIYYSTQKLDAQKAKMFKEFYAEGLSIMLADQLQMTTNPVLEDSSIRQVNPNLYVQL